ncbi:MAG: biotin--[acetyl-CoA-carboxylase] ligase [Candidatus Poseidoniaceae archaeon]|nr:biotin--[acetyl-CoA-carboxylase] ligase [Candidatus Poseidoniaceae archaeon]
MKDGIFELSDSEAEISRLERPASTRNWTSPDGAILELIVPATVYPPREDTDLMCQTLRSIGPGKGKRLLEIGCGSGAASLYAASLGYSTRACDINPYAVAATRQNATTWRLNVEAHEGGPGPSADGGVAQWAGTSPHDMIIWNLPYLAHEAGQGDVLGPLEEAALLDTDQIGLVSRLMRQVREHQLLTKNGLMLLLVSGNKRGLETEGQANANGFAARCVATHTFEDGEELRVVAVWNPYAQSNVHAFETVDSTNRLALEEGTNEGDFFSAKQQTAGRGRRGRTWSSEAHCFAGSWLLRTVAPELPPGLLQIIGGYAVMKANQSIGVPAEAMALKWPNDLFIHDGKSVGKVAGVLVEGRSKGTTAKIVIGIGANFLQEKTESRPFPIADLSEWMGPDEREHYASVLHAIMASYFERREDIKSADMAHLTINLERALKDSEKLLGEPIYRNTSWTIGGLTDTGNLRLVHPQHGTEIIADGEDLTWPLTKKN